MLYQLVFQAAHITTTQGVPAISQGKLADCQCLRIPTANKTLCGGNTGFLFSRPPYFLGVAGSAFFHKFPEAEPNLQTELEVQANMLTSSSRDNIQPDLAVLREEQAGTQPPNRNIMPKENYASDIAFQESRAREHQVWGTQRSQITQDFSRSGFCCQDLREQEIWPANNSEQNLPSRQSRLLASFSVTHTHFIDSVSCSQARFKLLIFLPPSPKCWDYRLASCPVKLLASKISEFVSLPTARLCLSKAS